MLRQQGEAGGGLVAEAGAGGGGRVLKPRLELENEAQGKQTNKQTATDAATA